MRNQTHIVYFLCAVFVMTSCVASGNGQMIREAVMTEGMSIVAQTKYGELKIFAGKGNERSFTWDNETIKTNLIPREKRWHGTLGLYHPQLRPPHKNVVHMVVEEHETHYDSTNNAIKYMNKYEGIEDIYRDDGLFIRFVKKTSADGEIFIDILIVQIMINGEKPSELPGSQNNKIKVY